MSPQTITSLRTLLWWLMFRKLCGNFIFSYCFQLSKKQCFCLMNNKHIFKTILNIFLRESLIEIDIPCKCKYRNISIFKCSIKTTSSNTISVGGCLHYSKFYLFVYSNTCNWQSTSKTPQLTITANDTIKGDISNYKQYLKNNPVRKKKDKLYFLVIYFFSFKEKSSSYQLSQNGQIFLFSCLQSLSGSPL